jgi:hypothetical protein
LTSAFANSSGPSSPARCAGGLDCTSSAIPLGCAGRTRASETSGCSSTRRAACH